MCDPRLCNNLQACCAATIFSVLLVLFLVSVSSPSPSLALALTRPCPHSPSPSLALALTRPHPRPFLPSPLVTATAFCYRRCFITSTHQRSTPTHRHLCFSQSSSVCSRIFGIAAFLPLPPSLVTWGTSPNSARRHHSALQFYALPGRLQHKLAGPGMHTLCMTALVPSLSTYLRL